jgi:hypothetical protein
LELFRQCSICILDFGLIFLKILKMFKSLLCSSSLAQGYDLLLLLGHSRCNCVVPVQYYLLDFAIYVPNKSWILPFMSLVNARFSIYVPNKCYLVLLVDCVDIFTPVEMNFLYRLFENYILLNFAIYVSNKILAMLDVIWWFPFITICYHS